MLYENRQNKVSVGPSYRILFTVYDLKNKEN